MKMDPSHRVSSSLDDELEVLSMIYDRIKDRTKGKRFLDFFTTKQKSYVYIVSYK